MQLWSRTNPSRLLPAHDQLLIHHVSLVFTRSATFFFFLTKLCSEPIDGHRDWTKPDLLHDFYNDAAALLRFHITLLFCFLTLVQRRRTFSSGGRKIFTAAQLHYGYACCENAEILFLVCFWPKCVRKCAEGKRSNLTESKGSFYLFIFLSFCFTLGALTGKQALVLDVKWLKSA